MIQLEALSDRLVRIQAGSMGEALQMAAPFIARGWFVLSWNNTGASTVTFFLGYRP